MLFCNGKYWNGTVPACLGKYLHRFIIFFDLFFTVVASAPKTENELSHHTVAEESNDDDKLNEQTDLGNITIVETEAIEEIKSTPITNDITEDKLSNETQEKRFTVKHISEEIQDSDSEFANNVTKMDGIVHDTIEQAEEVVGVQASTTEEPILPENDENIEIAKIKDNSPSQIVLDSVKSSIISLEASASSNVFLSSFLILVTSSAAFK